MKYSTHARTILLIKVFAKSHPLPRVVMLSANRASALGRPKNFAHVRTRLKPSTNFTQPQKATLTPLIPVLRMWVALWYSGYCTSVRETPMKSVSPRSAAEPHEKLCSLYAVFTRQNLPNKAYFSTGNTNPLGIPNGVTQVVSNWSVARGTRIPFHGEIQDDQAQQDCPSLL